MLSINEQFKLVGLSLGIFASYSIMALYQEKIFKNDYEGEKFVYPTTFVALQCLVYFVTAKGIMMTHDHPINETPQMYYFIVALFYLLAMTTSNMAIQYIPYVVQVVGKACKPIPVMLFAVLIVKKSYTIQKYFFVLMIVFGVGLFIYKDGVNSSQETLWGYMLILISLLFDGCLGAAQDKMRIVSRPSSLNFMYYVNAWSTLIFIPLLFINYEGWRFVQFCIKHYEVGYYMAITVLMGTAGQYFISTMISTYGSLPLAIVTTLRKFLTILFSSLIFGNVLNTRQWVASILIFTALILDALFGKKKLIINKTEPVIKEESTIKENVPKGVA
ncbi:hypothetical protein ACKWTF_012209 [Chironomus riparius]